MNVEEEIKFAINRYASNKVSGMVLHDAKIFYLKILTFNGLFLARFIDKKGNCRFEVTNPLYDYPNAIENTIIEYRQLENQRSKFFSIGFKEFQNNFFNLVHDTFPKVNLF